MIREIWAALTTRRYGNLTWDGIIWGTAAVATLLIPAAYYRPDAGALVGFVITTIWVNGPLSPFLPATYEPLLMLFGRVYAPLLIGALGIAGTIYVEYLNYHLYRRLLALGSLQRLRDSRTVERLAALYARAPGFTVWLCAWSPVPYWTVRFLSPLAGYPVARHLFWTFVGRFPRLWFFAALGLYWDIGALPLLAIAAGSIALAATVWLMAPGRGTGAVLGLEGSEG